MIPADFLRTVWPDNGVYCLATPFVLPGTSKRVYAHKTFATIAAAAAFAEAQKNRADLFFAIHTLREPQVWNPDKTNTKTGELGAFEVRTQSNSQEARCFFFDLDVDPDKATKYASQTAALVDLRRFCTEAQLPKPMITSSGGGLHVYWLLTDSIPSEEWRLHAAKLRALAKHHGLKADPARTTDTASVLRIAGTFNFKANGKRPVEVLTPGKQTPTGEFLKLVTDAMTRGNVLVKATPLVPLGTPPADDLGSNLSDEFSGPPVTFKALVTACAQMQRQLRMRGNVSEPEWYHTINLVRFVENGDTLVHKISEGHPDYDPMVTDAKVAQLRSKGIKPTSCMKLAEVAGDDACEGCPFAGRVKSPIVAARYKDEAPAPVITLAIGTTTVTHTIPEPPKPFTRMKGGGISIFAKNKDGEEVHTVIYPHDLYPVRRLVNSAHEVEKQAWRVVLPREGAKEFTLDADALYDRRKFVTSMANQGVYPQTNHVQSLQDYMIAYIAELQRLADAETQCNHLGWNDDQSQFILPDKILLGNGSAKPASLSLGAERAAANVHKKGTLQRQVELLRFYAHPAYVAQQFYILGGLAAPIFYPTGHHGVIINASGDPGASKSTSLYTAASFWGVPHLYPVNGTRTGATTRGLSERVTTLANLPICVDEITKMSPADASDLAMGITQPGHRIRLERSGVERSASGSHKATIMLTTANNSLHTLLSVDNSAGTAGSMRVIEIMFQRGLVHKKHEADDYLMELRENYGHIGEVFMAHVMQHQQAVQTRVREVMKEIDIEAEILSGERFWSAGAAAVLVAAEISKQLGLLSFDPALIRQWFVRKQVPHMRGIVAEEYTNPLSTLADYLEIINGDILVVHKSVNGIPNVTKTPRGQLLAHYNVEDRTMWVLKKGFKDYCTRIGANHLGIVDELHQPSLDANGKPHRIVTQKQCKKVLGAGTDYAKAQSWCFIINMAHPEVSGIVELDTVANNPSVQPTPAKGNLKVV